MPINNPANVGTLSSPIINGLITGTAEIAAVLAAIATTSSASAQNITGFSFAIGATETWEAETSLWVTGGAAGVGVKLTASAPGLGTGSIRITLFGQSSGANTFANETITTAGTLSTTNFSGASTISGIVLVKIGVQNIGGSAGTIQLQYASSTAATNVSINANSIFKARRTA